MATGLLTTSEVSPLPVETYRQLPESELEQRIEKVKRDLGSSLLILGHHYQQDQVIRYADLRGDSLKLSQLAATSQECRSIVFCGVHFMAETADILSRPEVQVFLPDMSAGCSMADMADLDSVEAAWSDLGEIIETDDLMPVTYINSAADLKAFCGRHGGIVCTSSNAQAVLEWALANRRRVFFFPDQHLGRNTARSMGIPLEQMAVSGPPIGTWGQYGKGHQEIAHLAVEGPLLGSPDVQARARGAVSPAVSRHPDLGSSRVHDGSCRAGGPRRLDGVDHQDD